MDYIDIIILIPLIYFAWKGFSRGLIIELASLIGLAAGIWAAWHFSGIVEVWLIQSAGLQSKYLNIIAFILTMIAVIILVHITGKLLEKFIDLIALGFLNKMAGMFFGIMKGVLILSLFIYLINTFAGGQIMSEEQENQSMLYKPIAGIAPLIIGKINMDDFKFPQEEETFNEKSENN